MKAIIFDLYNTLIYTKERRSPYIDFFSSIGLSKGETKIWIDEVLTNNYNTFSDILDVIKPGEPIYVDKWNYEIEQEISKTEVFDDTYYVLENLSKKYKLFLLSNISTPYKKSFYNLKLDQYFTKAFFSCDIGYRKPQAEAFQTVIRESGYKANQLLMIGDSINSDVRGANNVGISAILKDKSLMQIYQNLI